MRDEWQVGDLAVCISEKECDFCEIAEGTEFKVGEVDTVIAVYPPQVTGEPCGLDFANHPASPPPRDDLMGDWCECGFRKIRPDEHEACEPEFVTLLKRRENVDA